MVSLTTDSEAAKILTIEDIFLKEVPDNVYLAVKVKFTIQKKWTEK